MSEPLGHLCIVLHGHLPYVLNHGTYPHGEAWLFEAAAETYLPLLEMVGEVALNGARAGLTVGLTPVLLEQLAHPRFREGFVAYLKEWQARAAADRRAFERAGVGAGERHLAQLATQWEAFYARGLETFERIGRDIAGQFAARCREGQLELLTSNATHAYLPLLLTDEAIQAQMACGLATSRKHLGFAPKGMWLPECAYRGELPDWMPAALYGARRYRPGLELFVGEVGVTHFCVDTHLVAHAMPLGVVEKGRFASILAAQLYGGGGRVWGSVLEPAGVVSRPEMPKVWALARHPQVSEQVWSGAIGYPGAGEYLDFHRKHGEHGLRYHRVTDHKLPLADKQPYEPEAVPGKIYEHAGHFVEIVRAVLRKHRDRTGQAGTVVAPFDAELFGHWWFEGIRFLKDVILTLNAANDVKLVTAQEAVELGGRDKAVRMPEGSWGEGGDHRVWMNEKSRWMWEGEYRAEGSLLKALYELPWRKHTKLREMLQRAGRQLLLLQASDWPFVVYRGDAADYGIARFAGHLTEFNRALEMAYAAARRESFGELQKVRLKSMDLHDSVFADVDLNWWIRNGH